LLVGVLAILFVAGAGVASTVDDIEVLYISGGSSPGTPFSGPLGIFFDKTRDEIYVADTGNHQIVVFDKNGLPVFNFPHLVPSDNGSLAGEPKSVVVDSGGQIFVTDGMVRFVDVLDHMGRRIQTIDPPSDECDDRHRFEVLALGSGDEVYAAYVCDGLSVAVIDSNLNINRVIALASPEAGRHCISDIDVGADGMIYVTDPCAETMVQVFLPDGRFHAGFGRHDAGFENFSFPAGIAVMSDGLIWIVDAVRQIASCFSIDGEFLHYIGGRGAGPGAFDYPSALATDRSGRLFVLERVGNRYQCFKLAKVNRNES
jgi:DNA-binding beta-propeller fold protein YncE